MRCAQFAVAFDIPLLQKICQTLVTIFHFLIVRYSFEDLAIFFIVWIINLNLMAQALSF